jgi:hypothetical protein
MTKFALLIGVSEYLAGGLNHLRSLPSALIDVDVLSAVLGDPQRGGFPAENITVLKNPDVQEMRDAIYRLFHNRQKTDLILLYFSGHGIKDEQNDLYLATKITRKNDDNSLDQPSAVPATDLHKWMKSSKSQHQVIILDSCFSGAIANGMTVKDDGIVRVKDYFGGKGTAILTSSTSTEYSLSPEPIDPQNTQPSIYTRYLVEGLTTGAADLNKDGDISADELHEYVAKKVKEVAPSMTPKFFPAQEGYKLLLSKAPRNDRKLEYEQKVQEYADKDRGKLSRLHQLLLKNKQREWGISPSDAQIIEDRVLQPFLEYEEKLKAYEQELTELVQSHYPFSARDRADLQEYQQELKLRDKDIAEIHQRLLPQASSTQPNPTPAAIPTALSAPVPQPPVIEPTQPRSPVESKPTYDRTNKSIKVFISHNNNQEDNQFIRRLRRELESSRSGIKFWQEIEEGKLLSDKKSARKENINKCDCFLVIVSQKFLDVFELNPHISEEIGLAYSLFRSSLDNQPKIIFLCKDLEDISGIEISIRDFDTSDPIPEKIKIRDWERFEASTNNENESLIKLRDLLLPPIIFIDDLDEDINQQKWFEASQKPYEEEFFPVESERLPFEEIRFRINEYNSDSTSESEWREVYAVWHFDRNTNDRECAELANYVIGMGYVCVHLPSGWCFGNYIAIKEIFRVANRVNFFADRIQEKIQDHFLASRKNQPKGIVFEVKPIDFNFLIQICESREDIAGSQHEEKFLNELRQLLRLNWFLTDPQLKNVYIILENDNQNQNSSNPDILKAKPFSYIQPGMDDPVEDNNITLLLMVYLFEDNLSNQQVLSSEIIEFLFEELFSSGSDEEGRAFGYHENVRKIKQEMVEKYKRSNGFTFGKIDNIYVDNGKYDVRKLKNKAHKRATNEGLSSQLKF